MNLKYLPLLVLVLCASCKRTTQVKETETFIPVVTAEDSCVHYPIKDNRIRVDLDKPEKASLFDYFSHIEITPLETNDNVLIEYCEEVNSYQGRYYLFDRPQAVIQVFDENGKFIFKIDKKGQGPGEYTANLTSVIVNPFTGNIDVHDLGKIYSYDLTGKHVRTILRPENTTNYYWNFIALNENLHVAYIATKGGLDSYRINYYDQREHKIIHREYENDAFFNKAIHISSASHTFFYEYNRKWFFYHLADNATYEVGVDSLTKAYAWDFGKYNYDPKNLNLPDDPFRIVTLPYLMNLQGQNNRYLFAQIGLRNNTPKSGVYLIHDKATDECKYIEHFDEPVDFNPRKVTNEYVLTWCEHGALENYITEEMLNEENREKFQKLLDAEEEQNPIILKYYFK